MAVASPRLFLALRLFLPPSVSVSLPAFLPLPLYSPIVLIVLFVLPLALNPSHTQLLPTYIADTRRYTPIHIRVHAYARIHPREVHPSMFSLALCTILRSFLLLLFIVPFLLPSCSFHSRATTYVCPDLKIVRLVPSRSP